MCILLSPLHNLSLKVMKDTSTTCVFNPKRNINNNHTIKTTTTTTTITTDTITFSHRHTTVKSFSFVGHLISYILWV